MNIDDFFILNGPKTRAQNFDTSALRAKKIYIALNRHGHEAPRQRNVSERRFIDALQRS